MESISSAKASGGRVLRPLLATAVFTVLSLFGLSAFAQGSTGDAPVAHGGGEDSLVVPSQLDTLQVFGMSASHLLQLGLIVSALGIVFGLVVFMQLKNAPVHKSMLEVSELIYETCKTYLFTQAKFIALLWLFIGTVIVVYYGVLKGESAGIVVLILFFSVVGIAGSGAVALFGIRVNTFANSRTAFASLRGKPYPVYAIPLKAGMSIGMMLISIELAIMLGILTMIRTSTRASASSASRSASRSAPRRSASPAESSRRSPTSGRPDEDRLQDQGRRRA